LFLLVADVLQRMIKSDSILCHPLDGDAPCLVLQYANDTLVILRGGVAAVHRLKAILDMFAEATRLRINFHKSTVVPMAMGASEVAAVRDILGCKVEGFPQTYLGLPLSCVKLKIGDFNPLIAKIDKYLSGWRALLLSSGGRIVLLNAVLDALPVYAMGAMLLPPALIRAIDALRRAFLWNAAEKASGAKCLVAWESVCRSKEEGGLGIRSLAVQNECLQVKLLHRLHSRQNLPWASWVWRSLGGPIGSQRRDALAGPHWNYLAKLMPLYRGISFARVGDGVSTSFWLDRWVGDAAFCDLMPALFSHVAAPAARSAR
jgi:hypothetical protein